MSADQKFFSFVRLLRIESERHEAAGREPLSLSDMRFVARGCGYGKAFDALVEEIKREGAARLSHK
jgi:hypothetical protein